MKVWRSALLGVMGLAALQAAVGSSQGPGRIAGILGDLGRLSAKFLDPTVPAFAGKVTKTKPKASTSSTTTSSSSTSTTTSTPTAATYPATDTQRLEQLLAGATPGSPAAARIAQQIADTPPATTKPRTGLSATRIASET